MSPVVDALARHGRWQTIAGLCADLGMSRRDVEAAIEAARLAGEPVIGSGEGVRYTTDPREVRAYAEDRRRRLVSIAKGTRQLLRTARRLEGSVQETLWAA